MNEAKLTLAANILARSRYTVAMTGAGISEGSGIPAFRGTNGLWEKYDPEIYAHIDTFLQNPARSWQMFLDLYETIQKAVPNESHQILAQMEKNGLIKAIITQNIDNLHQSAGSKNVIEIHGNLQSLHCLTCKESISREGLALNSEKSPPLCHCGGVLKPDVILFGETISSNKFMESFYHIQKCKVLLVIGTSGLVQPINRLPASAIQRGASLIEINREPSEYTQILGSLFLQGESTEILKKIVAKIY